MKEKLSEMTLKTRDGWHLSRSLVVVGPAADVFGNETRCSMSCTLMNACLIRVARDSKSLQYRGVEHSRKTVRSVLKGYSF